MIIDEIEYPRSATEGIRLFTRLAAGNEAEGRIDAAWACLEAIHILAQQGTSTHVRSHLAMLQLAWRTRDSHEVFGQMMRLLAAAMMTWLWVPRGNSGRATMSAIRSARIPRDLQLYLDAGSSVNDA